jgi:hypothetical protein
LSFIRLFLPCSPLQDEFVGDFAKLEELRESGEFDKLFNY